MTPTVELIHIHLALICFDEHFPRAVCCVDDVYLDCILHSREMWCWLNTIVVRMCWMSAVRRQLVCQSLPFCSRRLYSTALSIYTVHLVYVKGSNIPFKGPRLYCHLLICVAIGFHFLGSGRKIILYQECTMAAVMY